MRKVGRLLGGRYQSRMNVSLLLLMIIPFFLSLIPDMGNEALLLVVAMAVGAPVAAPTARVQRFGDLDAAWPPRR